MITMSMSSATVAEPKAIAMNFSSFTSKLLLSEASASSEKEEISILYALMESSFWLDTISFG